MVNKFDDAVVASIMTGVPIQKMREDIREHSEVSDAINKVGIAIFEKSKNDREVLKNISSSICYLLFPLTFDDRARVMLNCTRTILSEKYNTMEETIKKVKDGIENNSK